MLYYILKKENVWNVQKKVRKENTAWLYMQDQAQMK